MKESYNTLQDMQSIKVLLKQYPLEYLFMRIHSTRSEARFHQKDEVLLLTINTDQIDKSVTINIWDREMNREVTNKYYRFRRPIFDRLQSTLFNAHYK